MRRQNEYAIRKEVQKKYLNLPLFPSITIGSFLKTPAVRCLRRNYKQGILDEVTYEENIRQHIVEVIGVQVDLGLDMLVHGKAERNDMVEYFGEFLEGIALLPMVVFRVTVRVVLNPRLYMVMLIVIVS